MKSLNDLPAGPIAMGAYDLEHPLQAELLLVLALPLKEAVRNNDHHVPWSHSEDFRICVGDVGHDSERHTISAKFDKFILGTDVLDQRAVSGTDERKGRLFCLDQTKKGCDEAVIRKIFAQKVVDTADHLGQIL